MSFPEMDVYEKVKSLEFSLESICAVKVVRQILDSVGVKKKDYKDFDAKVMLKHINTEASKRVDKLHLSIRVKELLAGLIRPIFNELHSWHNTYRFESIPTWSPHGTVDLVQSTRTVVNDPNLKTTYRFKVACAFCHERQICKLAKQMTEQEMADIVKLPDYAKDLSGFSKDSNFGDLSLDYLWRPYTNFWLNVFRGGSFELPLEMCKEGLALALDRGNDAAVMYFLGKGDAEEIRRILSELFKADRGPWFVMLPPATCCLLFSKMSDEDLRRMVFDDFVESLLRRLARWPYQPLFLNVVRSLSVHTSEKPFSRYLQEIAGLAAAGYKDFDYRGLFFELFDVIVSLNPHWSIGDHYYQNIALYALSAEDEPWMKFLSSKYSDLQKECLLLDNRCFVCTGLIDNRKFHLLEPFIRFCGENRMDLLLKLRDTLKLPKCMLRLELDDDVGLRLVSQIVNKIIEEQETSTAEATSASVVREVFDERRRNKSENRKTCCILL